MQVAKLAQQMAQRLGADSQKAYLAGVLHDIAKEMPVAELLDICKTKGIKLSVAEENNIALLHAPVGACIIKDFGVNDAEVIDAVRYHTVGRAGMSLLEKIIYLADMIEPGRSFPEAAEIRAIWEDDFDEAFTRALKYSILWNVSEDKLMDKGTVDAFNDMILERNGK